MNQSNDWRTQRHFRPATYITFFTLMFFFFVVTGWIVDNSALQEWLRVYVQARA